MNVAKNNEMRGGASEAIHARMIQNIRTERISKGLFQMEVCLNADLSQSYYAKVESGKAHPSALTVIRIALTLGITPQDLFPKTRYRTRDCLKQEIKALIYLL